MMRRLGLPVLAAFLIALGGIAYAQYVSGGGGSGASGANPTASVGTSAVNGSATTFLRSDGAPAINQAMAPTWTGAHTWSPVANATPLTVSGFSLTGSGAVSLESLAGTLNTTGVPDVVKLAITDTAHGTNTKLFNIYGGASATTSEFSVDTSGNTVQTGTETLATGSSTSASVIFTGTTDGIADSSNRIQIINAGTGNYSFEASLLRFIAPTIVGWSSSGSGTPAINNSADTAFSRVAAGEVGCGTGGAASKACTFDAATVNVGTSLQFGSTPHLLCSATAPTISSGFGTSPSIVANNGTCAFQVNVGTGGSATSGVIGLPAASNGWNLQCTDITTNSTTVFLTKQTASTTTTATVGNFSDVAVASAWTASDKLNCSAFAF